MRYELSIYERDLGELVEKDENEIEFSEALDRMKAHGIRPSNALALMDALPTGVAISFHTRELLTQIERVA